MSMVIEGFNAIKQPEAAQSSEPQTEQKAETATEQSPPKKNRHKRAVLTQDDVDGIFDRFLEYVCAEEEFIRGVIRSDEKVRSGTPD